MLEASKACAREGGGIQSLLIKYFFFCNIRHRKYSLRAALIGGSSGTDVDASLYANSSSNNRLIIIENGDGGFCVINNDRRK